MYKSNSPQRIAGNVPVLALDTMHYLSFISFIAFVLQLWYPAHGKTFEMLF